MVTKFNYSKSRQRLKLILSRPDFIEKVKEIRQEFNIPPNGLTSNEDSKNWQDKLCQKTEDYFDQIPLKRRKEIIDLKNNGKYHEAELLEKQENNAAPLNSWRVKVKLLLKKYKLPLNFEESIRRFIMFNDPIDKAWISSNIFITEKTDEDTGLKQLLIGINDETTLDDIKKCWSSICFHRDYLYPKAKKKNQPIKNFERNQRAYELKQEGKSLNEIAEIISKEYNSDYVYIDIADFIKKYKKIIGIN